MWTVHIAAHMIYGYCSVGMSAFQLSYTTEQLFVAGMLALIRKEAPTQEYVHIIGRVLATNI